MKLYQHTTAAILLKYSDMRNFMQWIQHVACPSTCLTGADVLICTRSQTIISSHLDHKWEALKLAAVESRDPILYTYASDGWGGECSA
jgi:hypothetical protein